MECARGLCCALRFWSPSARPTAGAREVSEEARFGQVRKALTTRYDNSTAATGIRLCEWRWAFAFSGPRADELCDQRFAWRANSSRRNSGPRGPESPIGA
jgi:hypothetical protein